MSSDKPKRHTWLEPNKNLVFPSYLDIFKILHQLAYYKHWHLFYGRYMPPQFNDQVQWERRCPYCSSLRFFSQVKSISKCNHINFTPKTNIDWSITVKKVKISRHPLETNRVDFDLIGNVAQISKTGILDDFLFFEWLQMSESS